MARKGSLEIDPWAFFSVLSLSTWLLLLLALLVSGAALVALSLSRWANGRYPLSQALLTDLLRILVLQGTSPSKIRYDHMRKRKYPSFLIFQNQNRFA